MTNGNEVWLSLRAALGDAFDPEYCESGSVKAIHWDAVSQVLSFEGHIDCINIWFAADDNGDADVVVEFNRHPGGMDPKTLWETP